MTDLERALFALAPDISMPATPDIASKVRMRLQTEPARVDIGRGWLRPALAAAALVFVVVAATLVFSPAARHAVADFLGIGQIKIEVQEDGKQQARIAEELNLGDPVTLEEARALAPHEVPVPAALGEPDEVYFEDLYPLGVSFVYQEDDDLPRADETGVGVLLTQLFDVDLEEGGYEKLASMGTRVDPVEVAGFRGYWLGGDPHTLQAIDENGRVVFDESRLAGNTLVWSDGENTYRLESALSKAEATAIAESLYR